MRLECSKDIPPRSQRARGHPVRNDLQRPIAFRLVRHQPGARAFSQKLGFPVRPDRAAPATRILRIGPAEGQVQQVAKGPPVFRHRAHRGRRVRVVAAHPRPDMDCAGQGNIDLQPPGVRVGRNVGHRPCLGRNARPQRFEEQAQRQVHLPAQDRIACIECGHVNVALIKGQETEAIFPLEGQDRDLSAQDVSPAIQDFWRWVAHQPRACPPDPFHHPWGVHVVAQ